MACAPLQCAVCLTDRVIATKHVERPPPHCCRAEQAMKLSRGVSRFVRNYCGILCLLQLEMWCLCPNLSVACCLCQNLRWTNCCLQPILLCRRSFCVSWTCVYDILSCPCFLCWLPYSRLFNLSVLPTEISTPPPPPPKKPILTVW